MGQAALTFLGVILGAAIAGGVSLWQVHLVTTREREAREARREQERKDRRDAFQRETMLALQDAIEDLRRETVFEFGKGAQSPISADWLEKNALVKKLWARVFDVELRSQVTSFLQASCAQSSGHSA